MQNAMPFEKCKTLGDINDILIVRKIPERDPSSLLSKESLEEESSFSDFDTEQHLLAEEEDAIVRKQFQLLQADERGKQALISEIAAIKQRQEQRAELLRNRQHALDVEKQRARRIASLPPPLPKSVKLLLRKHDDEPEICKSDVQMPDELTAIRIKVAEPHDENKENIIDSEELEAKQKMQEEWQMRAKKRFNEALKKDRQKEEYSKIMKQIQNAELLNRREMAKNISSDKRSTPCPLSDKFQTVKKQTDMEDAAEKVFKKMNKREHVIEDIEGYQDYYEDKYKKIDSDFESKMIDCIPNFVKENYEYLLEDESTFQGGKHFSGLEDSVNDILNQAYIETPPDLDSLDGKEKIDLAINQLDKLRSDLQTEYDQTLKPLLIAAIEVPKKKWSDKAVETEALQLPVEDKSVETDVQFRMELTTPPSPPPSIDFKNAGVMAFKRKRHGPVLHSFEGMKIPDMHQRDIHYTVPLVSQSERFTPSSWSSSSYCSLPSQHGFPCFPNATESVKCDICIAEMKKECVKDNLPYESSHGTASFGNEKSNKSIAFPGKAPLSEYVKQLANKYLVAKSTSSSQTIKESTVKSLNDSYLPTVSNTETPIPAFEKEVISKTKADLFVGYQKSEVPIPVSKNEIVDVPHSSHPHYHNVEKSDLSKKEDKITIPDSSKMFVKRGEDFKDTLQEKIEDDIYNKIKGTDSPISPAEYSEYDMEAKRIQAIHQIFARRFPRFALDLSPKPANVQDPGTSNNEQPESLSLLIQSAKPHVYHELSTIPEMDSALTAGSLHLSQSKLSETSIKTEEKSKDNLEQSGERLKMVSLLDPPDTNISELAKSIQFVAETEVKTKLENEIQPIEVHQRGSSECLEVVSVSSKDDSPVSLSVSDLNTCPSVSSSGNVFSSSLDGNHAKSPYLRGTKNLPQYFVDVSDIQQKNSISKKYGLNSSVLSSEFLSSLNSPKSSSSSSQSIPSVIDTKPMEEKDTINSLISGYISSPALSSKESIPSVLNTKSGENTNVPSLVSGYISNIGTSDASSSGVFQPMTPHSDISSPSVFNDEAKLRADVGKSQDFNPYKNFPVKYGRHVLMQPSLSDSSGSFKPMTPYSNISSPSEKDIRMSEYHGYASSTGSFKALTPVSMISSPSFPDDETEFKNKYSSVNSEFHPMTVRFDISINSLSDNTNNQSNSIKKLPEMNYGFTLKADLLSSPKYLQSSKVLEQKVISEATNVSTNKRKNYHIAESQDNVLKEKELNEIKSRGRAQVCSSDYFVPQLSAADLLNLKKMNDECHLKEGTLDEELDENATLGNSSQFEDKFSTMKNSAAEFISSGEEILAKNIKREAVAVKSKEADVKKDLHDWELVRGFNKQYGSLQAVSSNSSSTENLSEISGSKVLYQSTPIKSVEELTQEPGILEEPDLTLITSGYSCSVFSPTKPKEPANASVDEHSLSKEESTFISYENESKTPNNQSPQILYSADTPSMLSFLQHEMSILQKDEVSVAGGNPDLRREIFERETHQKENQRSEFPRKEYKKRTKRLWNNLEEVKRRNLVEERKKQMAVNRLKAKEFAKKITPKKKQ